MPGGVNTVSMVNGVNPIDPVGQAIAEQQAQRQQDLADTLRAHSLQPIQVQSGNISWTQGLAQLAQALVANHLNHNAMAGQYQAATQAANARMQAATPRGQAVNLPYDPNNNPYNGSGQHRNLLQKLGDFVSGGPPVNRPVASPPSAQPQPTIAPPSMPVTQGAGPTPVVGQPAPSQSGAPVSPITAPPAGAVTGTGAMSLTGDPSRDFTLNALYPADFGKAVVANATPTDIAKQLTQSGIDPNSDQGRAYMTEGARKAALTPIGDDRRGYLYDPYTGAPKGYHPLLETGQQPTADASGNVNGAVTLPGFAQSSQDIAAAHARGAAQGEVVQLGTDTNGRPIYGPKSDQLGGSGSTAPANGAPGSLNNYYNRPQPGSPPAPSAHTMSPQDKAAQEAQGGQSATDFKAIADAGGGSADTAFALRKIASLASGLNTGPGAGAIANIQGHFATAVNGLVGSDVIPTEKTARVQEISKLVSQIAQQQSAALGGPKGATDARLSAAFASLPDAEKAPGAIRDITSYLVGNQAAIAGKAAAASHYQQADPTSAPKFKADWQRNYDPRIFQWMQDGPQNFGAHVRALPQSERNVILGKYSALKSMGAF